MTETDANFIALISALIAAYGIVAAVVGAYLVAGIAIVVALALAALVFTDTHGRY